MPAAARNGGVDTILTGHPCDGTTVTDQGSSDVFVNSSGVVRFGDLQQVHNILVGDSCVPHALKLSSCSSTVFINAKGAGRKGDSYGDEVLISGSETVFIGG